MSGKCEISYKVDIVSTIDGYRFNYIDDLIEALRNVDERYYSYTTVKDVTKYPERVFAYELYHQLRKIMEQKSDMYDGIYLNGEQTKSKEVIEGLDTLAPDLILHKCIYDRQPEHQFWLCEIKMKRNSDSMSDLSKFNKYEPLEFPCYIFLYAGVSCSEMVSKIQQEGISKDSEAYEKTICISSYNSNGVIQIHCHSLKDIVERNI